MLYFITLYHFSTILLSLSHSFFFFFSLGVCTYQSSIKKEKKMWMFFIGKRLSDCDLFVECNSSSIHFCLSSLEQINVGVDIYQPVSSESSNLTYTQRLLPLPPHRPGFYITMLNMCKISGQWDSLFDEVSRRVKQVA